MDRFPRNPREKIEEELKGYNCTKYISQNQPVM